MLAGDLDVTALALGPSSFYSMFFGSVVGDQVCSNVESLRIYDLESGFAVYDTMYGKDPPPQIA